MTVEQKAELYREELKSNFFLSEPQLDCACQGFKDGYHECEKEHEWHYPSKGEYPEDEFVDECVKHRLPSSYKRHYCLYFGDKDCVMGKYMRGLFHTAEGLYTLSEIVAWKEIFLPEEIKEND